MAREPHYPKDMPVGGEATASTEQTGQPEQSEKDVSESGAKDGRNRAKKIVTGAAIGIGSAALVAALLYANRSRKNDKGNGGR